MNVAFIALSNHIYKTHSSDFFIDLLRELYGQVYVMPHERAWLELPKRHWDLIVVWQRRYTPEELESFGADRVVLVPMYDDCPLDENYWKDYRAFKVFCFSSTLERALRFQGIEAWGARYYPETPDSRIEWDGLKGFFWPRIESIGWPLVARLTEGTRFERMHVHGAPEGSIVAPGVEVSSWFANQAEYRAELARANVFFAPRPSEGIGLSFLEALALGQCVAAPDGPTMNEYITDGVNGLLYDPRSPRPLDFSKAKDLGFASRESCIEGRKRWLAAKDDIRRFLEEPARGGYSPKAHPIIATRGRLVARLRYIPGLFAFYRRLRDFLRRSSGTLRR
jgi:glycosyltransferase involved in cell wall biosynthesis